MSLIKNKVVLITGGANGIGWALVKSFLSNGAKGVSILDIAKISDTEYAAPYLKSGKILEICCDITKKTELEDAFKKTIAVYNQLDVVINNAGICDEVKWEMTLSLNLESVIRGTLLAMKEYLPNFKSGDEGLIVNIASIAGIYPAAEIAIYCAVKSGVIQLGRSFGSEAYYERYKVRIITVCPGGVSTTIQPKMDQDVFPGGLSKEEFALMIFQSPEETANAIMTVIDEGKNGSVWITEERKAPYEIQLLSRNYH